MAVTVRRASSEDAEHLVRCNCGLATETEDKDLPHEIVLAGVHAALADAEKGFYLIADVDGVRAGALMVTTEWSDWNNAYYWWIQSVFVLPEHRSKGAYGALHREVERLAREAGDVCSIRLYVDTENARAKAVYRALGMAPGRYDFYETDLRETF
jgi:GNAT superfamily N-acetyltransferase